MKLSAQFQELFQKIIVRDRQPKYQIAATSFLILFLELLLIRWLGAHILHLAYFSNLVLLASFFGIGLGILLSDKKSIFSQFPLFLLASAAIVAHRLDVSFVSNGTIYFQDITQERLSIPFWLMAPSLFAFIAAIFVGPAQFLGSLFKDSQPLLAYKWDIIGSIGGIIAFSLCSLLGLPPIIWYTITIITYFYVAAPVIKENFTKHSIAFLGTLLIAGILTLGTIWSPYYKIVVAPIGEPSNPSGYVIYANETGHQTLQKPSEKEWIYQAPYSYFSNSHYQNVLIIGAGSGTDVATALEHGAKFVDAVDIDPKIVDIGKRLHPSKPYSDPRVQISIADGRTFLERTEKHYDLIIYALTDSLALASSYSNTRLESYLYTQESINLAKSRLSTDGLLVMYNYYREPWLVDKFANMLEVAFNKAPYVIAPKSSTSLAAMLAGPRLAALAPSAPPSDPIHSRPSPSTDEWPFAYMIAPALPGVYLATIVAIIAISIGTLTVLCPKKISAGKFKWHFFFLGAGFLLLETKNVINFQLLFGSTWIVNALVFFAILFLILIAILTTQLRPGINQTLLFTMLALTLLANLAVPLSALAVLPSTLKYISAAILTLSPLFFANLIFSNSFKNVENPDTAFAANLLGAMLGGFSEYAAMLVGYHWIMMIAIGFYGLAWLFQTKK